MSVKDSNNEWNLATYLGVFNISDGVEERLTIDSSGNVGIGTDSPIAIGGHSGILTLYGSNATALVLKDVVSEGHLRFDDSNF